MYCVIFNNTGRGYSNTGTFDEIVEVDEDGLYVTTHPAD